MTKKTPSGGDKDNVTPLFKTKTKKDNKPAKQEKDELAKMLALGLEAIKGEITAGADGIICIVLNSKEPAVPNTIWAGMLDPITVLGTIEVMKTEFLTDVYQFSQVSSEDLDS